MKTLSWILPLIFFSSLGISASDDEGIGQEYIKSSKYPKFSLSGEYNFLRHGKFLGEKGIASDIGGAWGGSLSIEVGLYKYMNAGAIFSTTIGDIRTNAEPLHFRFSLFAKPLVSIKDRVIFFGRFGGGLSVMAANPKFHFINIGTTATQNRILELYGESPMSHSMLNPGGNAFATVGAEFFPFSRVGIALEWGIRADLYYIKNETMLEQIIKLGDKKSGPSIKYLGYDMPLTLTVHIIL